MASNPRLSVIFTAGLDMFGKVRLEKKCRLLVEDMGGGPEIYPPESSPSVTDRQPRNLKQILIRGCLLKQPHLLKLMIWMIFCTSG